MPSSIQYTFMDSPVDELLVAEREDGLVCIGFRGGDAPKQPDASWSFVEALRCEAVAQLRAYFAGERTTFDLPLAPEGTSFQHQVWDALQEIPYGTTVSYGAIARRLGQPQAAQAVGAANGANPLPIVVPCHRVVGSDGNLTGYGGGLAVKRALLALERRYSGAGWQTALAFD